MQNTGYKIGPPVLSEVVLYQVDTAKRAHKELFPLDDACYLISGEDIIHSVLAVAQENPTKLHIAAGWGAVLRVALWISRRPEIHEVFALIKRFGITDEELAPFRRSDIDDIFPWLYYGKRFDILKRLCHTAKAKTESKINRKKLLVYCHLVSDEAGRIISSNL